MDEQKSTLPSDVHQNYSEQYKLVCEICSEYDKENEKDTEEVKKKRFDKLMGLMQKVRKQPYFANIFAMFFIVFFKINKTAIRSSLAGQKYFN